MFKSQNFPNLISLSRGLLLSPLFILVVYVIQKTEQENLLFWLIPAWIILFASLLSDILDGSLARKYQTTSDLGVYLDPLMDKIFINSAYLSLIICNFVPVYHFLFLLIWVIRDITIIYLRTIKRGLSLKEPFLLAKGKTFFQGILLSLIVFSFTLKEIYIPLYENIKSLLNLSIIVLTIIITSLIIFTFFGYLWKFSTKR